MRISDWSSDVCSSDLPILFEALTYVTHKLTPATMDTEYIKNHIGADRVEYDRNGNILIITVGTQDFIIPLIHFSSRIYETIISEDRSVGKDFVITFRLRGGPYHNKKNKKNKRY